ncbi:MAG: hypothetical protein PHQ32_08085 [Firmicutes bacterium]|nr:hypothetical protein [Bacillota bacterium]
MKKKLGFILLSFFSLLQVVGIIGIFVFNDLSRKKVGVNHHVIVKKREFISDFMSQQQLGIYKVVLVVVLLLLLLYLIYQIVKRVQWWRFVSTVLGILAGVVLYLELILDWMLALPIYMYLLYMTLAIFLIGILNMIIVYFIKE